MFLALLAIAESAQFMPYSGELLLHLDDTNKDAVMLILDQPDEDMFEAFRKAAELSSSPKVVFCYANNGMLGYHKVLDHFRRKVGDPNAVMLIGYESYLTFQYEQDLTDANKLVHWVTLYEEGKLTPYLKSGEQQAQPSDSYILRVTSKSFHKQIWQGQKEIFFMIYAPSCQYCHETLQTMESVAYRLQNNPNIRLAIMNGQDNELLEMRPTRYPHIVYVLKNRQQVPYLTPRTEEGLINWIKEETEYEWVQPLPVRKSWIEEIFGL